MEKGRSRDLWRHSAAACNNPSPGKSPRWCRIVCLSPLPLSAGDCRLCDIVLAVPWIQHTVLMPRPSAHTTDPNPQCCPNPHPNPSAQAHTQTTVPRPRPRCPGLNPSAQAQTSARPRPRPKPQCPGPDPNPKPQTPNPSAQAPSPRPKPQCPGPDRAPKAQAQSQLVWAWALVWARGQGYSRYQCL